MAKKKTNKKIELEKLSFEQAIETLTGIVDKIEAGQVPLAESLEQYEQGMALIRHCRGILLDAEKRIEEIGDADAADVPDQEEDEEPDEASDGDDEGDDEALF